LYYVWWTKSYFGSVGDKNLCFCSDSWPPSLSSPKNSYKIKHSTAEVVTFIPLSFSRSKTLLMLVYLSGFLTKWSYWRCSTRIISFKGLINFSKWQNLEAQTRIQCLTTIIIDETLLTIHNIKTKYKTCTFIFGFNLI
jgi:hypothetical protein